MTGDEERQGSMCVWRCADDNKLRVILPLAYFPKPKMLYKVEVQQYQLKTDRTMKS